MDSTAPAAPVVLQPNGRRELYLQCNATGCGVARSRRAATRWSLRVEPRDGAALLHIAATYSTDPRLYAEARQGGAHALYLTVAADGAVHLAPKMVAPRGDVGGVRQRWALYGAGPQARVVRAAGSPKRAALLS
eukprot:gene44361-2870_t